MDERKGKSNPIDYLRIIATKDKRQTGSAPIASPPALSAPSASPGLVELERRPLKTHPTTPPDYVVPPEILVESHVELAVRFLGIVPSVLSSLDANNRTELLRCIDDGRRRGILPRPNSGDDDFAAILSIGAYDVKLSRHDVNEDLIVRLPTHEIGAVSYVNDDAAHYLAMKVSAGFGDGGDSKTTTMSAKSKDAEQSCDLVVLQVTGKSSAEEICSLVSQSFQLVYTEATMQFFDRQIRDGAGVSVSSAFPSRSGSVVGVGASVSNGGGRIRYHPSFSSSADIHSTWSSSSGVPARSSMQSGVVLLERSESDMSSTVESRELIEDFTKRLHLKLSNEELNRFASLLTQWHETADFVSFCQKVCDLFGPERKYMLVEMRPFIPEQDMPYFEDFLNQKGVYDFGSPLFLHGVGITESPTASVHSQQPPPQLQQLQQQLQPPPQQPKISEGTSSEATRYRRTPSDTSGISFLSHHN